MCISCTSKVFFAFGEKKGSFVIDTPKSFKYANVPAMSELLEQVGGVSKLRKMRYIGLGRHDALTAGWVDSDDRGWTWSNSSFEFYYSDLKKWISNRKSTSDLSITLGDQCYAAMSPDSNLGKWEDLYKVCETRVRETHGVYHVALGVDKDWVLIDGTNALHRQCGGNYKALKQIIDNKGSATITFIALNPWAKEQFFLMLDDDTAYFQLDPSLSDMVKSVLENEGIASHALVPYNATRSITSDRPLEKIKNKDFLQKLVANIGMSVVSGVASSITSALISGVAMCTVM